MAPDPEVAGAGALVDETFDALVMDYVESGESLADLERRLRSSEVGEELGDNDPDEVLELVRELRETRELASRLPMLQPPAHLNERILNMARAQQAGRSTMRLPRFIEPVTWLAAASLLLSCGYVLGMLTSGAPPGVTRVAQHGKGRIGGIAGDLTAGLRRGSVLLDWKRPRPFPERGDQLVRRLAEKTPLLAEAEALLEQNEVEAAKVLVMILEKRVERGATTDGGYAIDATWKARFESLRASLAASAAPGGSDESDAGR